MEGNWTLCLLETSYEPWGRAFADVLVDGAQSVWHGDRAAFCRHGVLVGCFMFVCLGGRGRLALRKLVGYSWLVACWFGCNLAQVVSGFVYGRAIAECQTSFALKSSVWCIVPWFGHVSIAIGQETLVACSPLIDSDWQRKLLASDSVLCPGPGLLDFYFCVQLKHDPGIGYKSQSP